MTRTRATTVVVRSNKLLVVKMRDPVSGKIYLFPPGGMVEAGETPIQAAVRETKEETGYEVSILVASELTAQYEFLWAGKNYPCLTHFYRAELLSVEPVLAERSSIVLGVQWVDVSKLLQILDYHAVIRDSVLKLVS